MKSIFKLMLASFALVLFASFADEAAAAVSLLLTNPDPLAVLATGPVLVTSLVNLNGSSEDAPNAGGTRALYIFKRRDVVGNWPTQADIVNGEITTAPTMKTDKLIAEYQFPDGTLEVSDDPAGDPGFQSWKHGLDFMLAGFGKASTGEIRKHLNSGCVAIVEMNDGQHVVVGASDNPLYLKPGFKSGKKGSDKRGYTVKGEQDGFMWGVLPLAPAAVALLDLQPEDDE